MSPGASDCAEALMRYHAAQLLRGLDIPSALRVGLGVGDSQFSSMEYVEPYVWQSCWQSIWGADQDFQIADLQYSIDAVCREIPTKLRDLVFDERALCAGRRAYIEQLAAQPAPLGTIVRDLAVRMYDPLEAIIEAGNVLRQSVADEISEISTKDDARSRFRELRRALMRLDDVRAKYRVAHGAFMRYDPISHFRSDVPRFQVTTHTGIQTTHPTSEQFLVLMCAAELARRERA